MRLYLSRPFWVRPPPRATESFSPRPTESDMLFLCFGILGVASLYLHTSFHRGFVMELSSIRSLPSSICALVIGIGVMILAVGFFLIVTNCLLSAPPAQKKTKGPSPVGPEHDCVGHNAP